MITPAKHRAPEGQTEEEGRSPQPATRGSGPLLQRDYVLVIAGSRCTPEEAIRRVRRDFPRFSPRELAEFTRPAGAGESLEVGDTMHIHIAGYGDCAVRVAQVDPRRLTLLTLDGHLEAGRITFSADRDAAGRLVLRIRSRARLRNPPWLAAYALLGKHAQTRVWVTFLERLAVSCGGLLRSDVLLATDRVRETLADRGEVAAPTV